MPKYYQAYNKKSLQSISKANYLRDFVLPNCIQSQSKQTIKNLKSATGQKDQRFYYIDQQQAQTQTNITPALLLNAFRKIYPNNNSAKIDSHSFVNTYQINTNPYLTKPTEFQELIDIVILQKGSSQGSESMTSRRTYIKISSCTNIQKSDKQTKDFKDYEVYIVHFLYASEDKPTIKWDTFVEKYVFTNISDQQTQPMIKISYSMLFSYVSSTFKSYTFLNFVSSNNSTVKFLNQYFDSHKGNLQRLKKLQSYLFHLGQLKDQSGGQDLERSGQPCYSLELKRERNIPAEHFMEYKKLKDRMLKSYTLLNKEFIQNGDIKDVDMKVQNMVCRFLIEHNYDLQKTKKELSEFLTFENDLRKNFRLSNFKYWTDMDIIGRIGFDRMGRPVVLFKTYNFFADKCHDVSDYMNYLFYFILIDTMNTCKGYVDSMILLADCSNNTMKNMKIQVNRRMVPMGLKYCPRMFFKLIPFKSTAIPYYAYTLAKPLLPPYSNQIILMVKEGDQKLALQQCLKHMDMEVIPQAIGGKNTIGRDNSQKNPSTRDE